MGALLIVFGGPKPPSKPATGTPRKPPTGNKGLPRQIIRVGTRGGGRRTCR